MRKFVIAAALGAAAALAFSGTAHAGTNTDVDGAYGAANFHHNGDKLSVDDYYGDDWGTRAQLQVWHHPSSTWMNHGNPCFDDQSTGGADGVTVCDYDVAEGTEVRIHLWASNSGATKDHRYSRVGVA